MAVIIFFVWQVNIVKIFKKIGGNSTFGNITVMLIWILLTFYGGKYCFMDTDFTIRSRIFWNRFSRLVEFFVCLLPLKQGRRTKSFDLYKSYLFWMLENSYQKFCINVPVKLLTTFYNLEMANILHFVFADSLIWNDLERVATSALG